MVFIICAKWWRAWQDYTSEHSEVVVENEVKNLTVTDPVLMALQLHKIGSPR